MSTLANSDLFIVQRPSGGNAGTYKIEWESILDNIAASPAVQFKGSADFTDTSDDPSGNGEGRNNGDLWVNTTAGTFAWSNPETANKAVAVGDYCIWDADDGEWRFIGAIGGDGSGAITTVDADAPLLMKDGATTGDVVVQSREATATQSGHVLRLAVTDDVTDGTSGPVVDAALLKSYTDSLPDGGITSVEGIVNPTIPGNWQNDVNYPGATDESTYVTAPIDVQNNREIFLEFASENQIGVSYIAPAGTNAVIDFTNATENYKPPSANGDDDPAYVGGNLDNKGMMTLKRTYVNFVPRNFDALNELPS